MKVALQSALANAARALDDEAMRRRLSIHGGHEVMTADANAIRAHLDDLVRAVDVRCGLIEITDLNMSDEERRRVMSGDTHYPPTAAELNALPPNLRRWIHELETDADPAGTIRRAALLADQNSQLAALVAELERPKVDER